jgi:hypothetical protein
VIGIDVGGNKYLLDGYCHRMKLSRRWELIKQLQEEVGATIPALSSFACRLRAVRHAESTSK